MASGDRPRPPDLSLNSSNFDGYTDNEQGYYARPASGGSLPPGAMAPHAHVTPTLEYQPVGTRTPRSAPIRDQSPESSDNHVQFAKYPPEKNPRWNQPGTPYGEVHEFKQWTPLPLRPWFWLTFVIILTLGAVALEVALHFSNKNQGWAVKNAFTATQGFMHYVYTFPGVVVGMIVTSIWAWSDIEFKRMQPYIDLLHGNASPAKSLLLDYTRINNFLVWQQAARNRHYIITLSSLMVVLTLCISPLSASVFTVRDTPFVDPPTTIKTQGVIGLNQDETFRDLTAFVNAAGFASAAVLYNLDDPDFIFEGWAIAPFEIPADGGVNGTIYANTSAILSDPGCQTADPGTTKMIQANETLANGTEIQGWNNSAVFRGCHFSWWVDKRAKNLFGLEALGQSTSTFGTDTSDCELLNTPEEFRAVAFWFFTYETTPPSNSIAFCVPNISLWDVSVELDITTRRITSVKQLAPFTSASNNSDLSGNITGSPLNGRAYNGAAFVLDANVTTDPFVLGRENATQLQLPAAVFQAASNSPQGRIGSFQAQSFVGLSTTTYRTYLALVAQTVYFLPSTRDLTVRMGSVRKRLWLSDVAVHLLAVAMLILAFFGTIVHLLHRADRRDLQLGLPPGTIASAVSVGGQTRVGEVLSGRQKPEDVAQVLGDKKFRIDPRTMKIVMVGEEGYEDAVTPDPRRRSVFGMLSMGMQPATSPTIPSRRFSKMSAASAPLSPTTPRSADQALPPRSAV